MTKPLNKYFQTMLEARKKNAQSFVYNNNTYVRKEGKNGIIVYKKK